MTILRQEIKIDVTGATAAQRELEGVSKSMNDMTRAGYSFNSMTSTWEKQSKAVTVATTEVAKSAGGLSTTLSAAGKGFAVLTRAASILPGFGIAGLLLAIGKGAEAIYEHMTGAADGTTLAADALGYYTRQANQAAAAVAALAAAQDEAARGAIGGALARGGYAGASAVVISASNERVAQQAEIDRLSRLRIEMERNPAAEVFTSADEARVLELQGNAAKLRNDADVLSRSGPENKGGSLIRKAFGSWTSEELMARQKTLESMRMTAADFDTQAGYIVATRRLSVEQIDDLIGQSQNAIEKTSKALGLDPKDVAKHAKDRKGGAGSVGADSVTASWRSRAGAMMDAADEERARKNRERDFVPPGFAYPSSDGEGAAPRGFAYPMIDKANPLFNAMKSMGESFNGTFDQMAASSSDAASIVVQSIGAITGALGTMATNLIIAGDAGVGASKKAAGNALAGLSAQAFGYAVMLEGMALVSLLVPVLGLPVAGGLAAAGGVMAGIGGSLAISARLLGADKLGVKPTRGGGGGAGASAAGTNPYQGSAQGGTVVNVMIGGEVVTRGVQVETRRQSLRGGISEPRMAMAT